MTGQSLLGDSETVPMPDQLHDEYAVLKLPDERITNLGHGYRTLEEAEAWRDELYRRKEEMRLAAEEWEREYGDPKTRKTHPATNEPVYRWNKEKDSEYVVVHRQFTAWARVGGQ